jgi:hypothetical protein
VYSPTPGQSSEICPGAAGSIAATPDAIPAVFGDGDDVRRPAA